MKLVALIATVLAALVAVGSAQASTPRERALTKQVATLKRENRALEARLVVCQSSTPGAVSTMTPLAIATTVLPAAYGAYEAFDRAFGYDGPYSVFQTRSLTVDALTGRRSFDYSFGVWRAPAA